MLPCLGGSSSHTRYGASSSWTQLWTSVRQRLWHASKEMLSKTKFDVRIVFGVNAAQHFTCLKCSSIFLILINLVWLVFRLFETVQSLFWSVFGLVSLYVTNVKPPHEFTEFVGTTMFGTYNIISLVVLLNMLIAMMNNSYQHIAVRDVHDFSLRFLTANFYIFFSFPDTFMNCLFFLSGSRWYGVEICKNKIVDELFWRRGDLTPSIQHHTQPEIRLLSVWMDKETFL